MVNAGEAIPKLVPAKAGTALEAATLPSNKIKFDRLIDLLEKTTSLPSQQLRMSVGSIKYRTRKAKLR